MHKPVAALPQRIIFPEPGKVSLQPFEPPPPPGPADVSVRSLYSLMSIGTETIILHARYDAGTHFDQRFSFPQRKTGVQTVGVIESVGVDVTDFGVGDRIFMRHAHTSHWTLPAAQCSPVPVEMDAKVACWCGLGKTAFRAAHVAPFSLGGRVLIVGAGPVGQMTLRWAASAGMQTIAVVDLSAERLAHARRGGATHVFNGALEDRRAELLGCVAEDGFPIVIDTTGNAQVFAQALSVAGTLGKLVLLGDTGYPAQQHLTSDMMAKGLTVTATHDHQDRDGWTQRRIDELFYRLVTKGSFPLEGLITHEFSPSDCDQAYALATDRRDEAMGILFDWTTSGW